MNILPLYNTGFNSNSVNRSSDYGAKPSNFGLKMARPISADTVSFKAKMAVLIEDAATKTNERLVGEATVFMDALEAIANKLEGLGVSFNRKYCEPHAIKSADAVVSKVRRSGTFTVPDRIRGTLYCKNIYDLSILIEHILPEFKKRDYVLADTHMPLKEAILRNYRPTPEDYKRGEVKLPDIDIRLDMRDYDGKPYILPDDLMYAMGERQPSGYEDIQLRFIKVKRDAKGNITNKSNSQLIELIILFGENYSRAKKYESENIYSYTRQFKELNLFRKGEESEIVKLIKDKTDKIKKIFSTEISQKVYENAKSQDIVGKAENIPINLGEENEKILTKCFDELEKLTTSYYNKQKKLKSKNERAIARIEKNYNEDKARLKEIRNGLTKAVDFYSNYNQEPKIKNANAAATNKSKK